MDPISWIVIMYVSACLTVDPVVFESPTVNPPGKFLLGCKQINDIGAKYPSLHPSWGQPEPKK